MAIVIGDNDVYQLAYTGAEVDDLLGKAALYERSKAYLPYIAAGNSYTTFFRFKISTGTTHCQILVAGVGRASNAAVGYYILDVRLTSGSINTISVQAISTPTTSSNYSITFGYYTQDGYGYVGVARTGSISTYGNPMTAEIIGYDPTGSTNFTVGNFYQGTSQPTGWTPV